VELATTTSRARRLMSQVNKVYSVSTIALVARELGVDEDWLAELAIVMDREDGLIWVHSLDNEHAMMAFTEMGVENLTTLIADLASSRPPPDKT
jgi:hypothetical protein